MQIGGDISLRCPGASSDFIWLGLSNWCNNGLSDHNLTDDECAHLRRHVKTPYKFRRENKLWLGRWKIRFNIIETSNLDWHTHLTYAQWTCVHITTYTNVYKQTLDATPVYEM